MLNKVAVIIVTYNGMQWIPKTLACIPEKYHIIVVDNNSSDDTVSYIQQHYKTISLFPQQKNLGFGGGNNLGIKYAIKKGADYVFLLNQDAYLNSNTIDSLVKMHKSNANYGILSPIHLNGIGNELDWNFSTYLEDKHVNEINIAGFNTEEKHKNSVYEVPFVNAAAWLLPLETLNTVGGFDPIFFHYGEDNNYCQRVLYHNLKIGVVASTFVRHDRINQELNPKIALEDALKKREKQLKVNWADITENKLFEVSQRKKNLFKKFMISLIKFNFKNAKHKWAEIKLINRIVPQIKLSRQKNVVKGRLYIDE
ncbi:glycosyltransferase family 2 protein [Hyunsoonleella flava]|uniref:Glycosyltransferase family 2 protein n=1 Tax=Hyunsoonleella flava TaxID=2527939 RepID=A0A4Q9FJB8_9FLAO|nr:glycosyltransferase [Hyunsoonleella flava]TBN03590.1 glycosyltransferase family 2 protein [Hyunsoonleella flava]